MNKLNIFFRWMVLLLGGMVSLESSAQTIYVDLSIAKSTCSDYDVTKRACGGGQSRAYNNLTDSANAAIAGDLVLIREGTYSETLKPNNSGVKGEPITFESYTGENAKISGASLTPAIDISNREYIVVKGLEITDVKRWLYALNAHNNIILNNVFRRAIDSGGSSKTGIFLQDASQNTIKDNIIEDSTQDNLSLIKSDRNVVEGNRFINANHTLWVIKCGNYNVLRNNYFYNKYQKIGEIYDCDGVGFNHEYTIKNSTKHNLVEENEFAYLPSSGNHSPFSGIQYAGQSGIIRRNIFHDTVGPALSMSSYSGEAEYNTDNRIYNNVFYKSDFAGVHLSKSASMSFSGNIFKNNILTKSAFVANDTRWEWYTDVLSGQPVQITIGILDGFTFDRNIIFSQRAGEKYLVAYGTRFSTTNPPGETMVWWEQNHPELFVGTYEVDPAFQDEASRSFRLKEASPAIDAGKFLTYAIADGSGTSMRVSDASYFYDGYGIPGEVGDLIKLEGSSENAIVIDINYETNTLKLDRNITWKENQGVSLDYSGSAPDIGAYEFGVQAPPSPPVLEAVE